MPRKTFCPDGELQEMFTENLVYVRSETLLNPRLFNHISYDLLHTTQKALKNSRKLQSFYENNKTTQELPCRFFEENELRFESRFESGNLAMAVKVSTTEYNLLLQTDVNSYGNTQWFYFSVTNITHQKKVRFNILNMCKKRSLLQKGMNICIYSQKNYEKTGEGWHRGGENIAYEENSIKKRNSGFYYTLSYDYKFKYTDDILYFAYSVPYTYTDLLALLDTYEQSSRITNFYSRKELCRTLSRNIVYLVTITEPGTKEEQSKKTAVIISARVHPGETVSSYVMKGVLEYLTSDLGEVRKLREKFIFKIIPMLNPDGVVNGNYRCSLAGVDLNRTWKRPNSLLHPEVYHSKQLIQNIAAKYKIGMVLDLHGHSIKKNIFFYGCNYLEAPHLTKIFPFFLSKQSQIVSYQECRFGVQQSKEKTFRVTMFKKLKIPNVFALEASFCGGNFGKYEGVQYSTDVLFEFGKELCKSFMVLDEIMIVPRRAKDFHYGDKGNGKRPKLEISEFAEIFEELVGNDEVLHTGEVECDSDESDSDSSEDDLAGLEIMNLIKKMKKTKSSKKTMEKGNVTTISAKTLTRNICKNCGKIDNIGHQCLSPKPSSKIFIKSSNLFSKILKKNGEAKRIQGSVTPIKAFSSIRKLDSEQCLASKREITVIDNFAVPSKKWIFNPRSFRKLAKSNFKAMNMSKSIEKLREIHSSQPKSPLKFPRFHGIIEGIAMISNKNPPKR